MARAQRKSTSRWQRDPEKEKFWRGKITGWLNSGLSIRAYCKRENISETCFYAWRREIKIRDRESGNSTAENAVADLPDRVHDSRGRSIKTNYREQIHPPGKSTNSPFVQLKVVGQTECKKVDAPKSKKALMIISPNGFTLKVSCDTDLSLLSNVVQILEDNNA